MLSSSGQFADGMELHFELVGDLASFLAKMPVSAGDERPPLTVHNGIQSLGLFEGLQIEVTYPLSADEEVARENPPGSSHTQTRINGFLRKPFDRRTLWLWVTPAPQDGIFDVSVEWSELHLPRTTWRVAARPHS